MNSLSVFLAAFLAFMAQVQSRDIGKTVDLLTGNDIDFTWMEIGFVFLTDTEWKVTHTTATNLRDDRDYSVFLSLPEYGGSLHTDGFPLVPKMKGPAMRDPNDNSLYFESRLIQPNDSACMKIFTVPKPLKEPIRCGWLIVQNGVYNVSENMFQVNSSYMGRNNSVLMVNDKPWLYHHRVIVNYTTGCDFDNPELPCQYGTSNPENLGRCDDVENPDTADCLKTWLHLGALQQIQTDINKFDNQSMFLSIRSRNVYTDRIELLMAPHSVGPDNPTYNPTYEGFFETYETLVPELVAYFIYEQNVRIRCIEGLHIETKIDFPITSVAAQVDFYFVYDDPPGLFGMIGSLVSLADSTTLRVFNNTETNVNYITQEDQCYDEETEHTNKETAFTFAIGESTLSNDDVVPTQCFIIYSSGTPTGEPTGQPSSEPSGEPSAVPSGEPSGSPSGEPSGVPSGEPSGKPSSLPSCEPSNSEPTATPTSAPTHTPTASPTPRPSASPTLSPTPIPTVLPTASPTWGIRSNCTFDFILVDTFGDGWVDVWANFTTTDMHPIEYEEVYSELHQPNCSYKRVSILSLTCSIEVSMLNGIFAGNGNVDGAITPWENYWYINFMGTPYVGGIDSFWKVKYGRVLDSRNMVNIDPDDEENECQECKHPKPKRAKELFGDDGNPHHDHEHPGPGAGGPGGGKGGPGGPGGGKGGPGGGKGGPGGGGGAGGGADSGGAGSGSGGGGSGSDDGSGSGSDDGSGSGSDDGSSSGSDDGGLTDDAIVGDYNQTDYNQTDYNQTEHSQMGGKGKGGASSKPKAKTKAKAKPKRPPPPYLVQIALYDQVGDGYYDNSGEFDPLYSQTDFDDIDVSTSFPNILAYPKYYIMTKDRKKLIKSPGSICPHRPIEYCEEALPYKGKFVFRFAGFEPWQTEPNDEKDTATWRFCGMSGGINEEFEFEMRDGVCYPVTNTLTDELYCELGFESAIEFAVTMNVTGSFDNVGELSQRDTALLEKDIAELFPSNVKVVVASMEHTTASSFRVEVKMTAIAEELGYKGSSDDQVEVMMTEIPSLFSKFLDNDLLLTNLMDDLNKNDMSQDDPLRHTEKISLLGVELLDIHFQDPNAGGAFSLPFDKGTTSAVDVVASTVSSKGEDVSGSVGVVSLVAVGAVVLVLALAVTRSRAPNATSEVLDSSMQGHGLLTDTSVRGGDVEGIGGEVSRTPTDTSEVLDTSMQGLGLLSDTSMREKFNPLVGETTSQMTQEGSQQQAVQYEDDLDLYKKYVPKNTLL